ncbi:C1 family peptidase [Methanobrevibacter sp.]|uniref:C1 family peptidase n=1 Tax=Methanobrevibacter sp. TaxID=66852 RepID=UPI003863F5F8
MFKFKKVVPLFLIFLLLLIIAPNFAQENQTEDISIGDVLSADDIYVDASNENDGNGSIDNPYKKLEDVNIEKDTVIHLNNGEYRYKSFRSLNNVTFIGESKENTVINCNRLEITSNNLVLKNLTIVGATFKNQGEFSAQNIIFKNSIGHALDEYGNSYGGCIYTSYKQDDEQKHLISLIDCYFINNTAEYGGAIYFDEGYMEINNCSFINNFAFNYGGAIACLNSDRVSIKKSKFINDYSINDAGGAIYILSSSLFVEDTSIINCSATFGSAITGLNAKLDMNNLYAFGNYAKYDGGAIYQMYGTSLITSSNFINNTASNGGALFLDNVTSLFLMSNKFINNSAKICAGAIFSVANREYQNTGNIFENNIALSSNDVYTTSTINPFIYSSNYTIFNHVAGEIGIMPTYYNLADEGLVTPVKDQQDSGNCWAFAVMAALESCILKSTGQVYDLSEENMKNMMASFSDYGWQIDVNEGGYDDMGVGYLTGWLGPIFESDDSFDDKSTLSTLLNSVLHIQDVVYIKRNNYLDNDGIKQAILKYGAVATGIYYSGLYLLGNSYYYYDVIMPSNHAVTIVGWDDSYSRYNFNHIPEGDGAFIVKNSWGEDWCDNGYFYVSYYDTKFAQVGKDEVSYTFILNDTVRYDKNYQYDISGKTDYLITGQDTIWYQNIFTATDDEYLAAVSTYFNAESNWDVSVYVNDVFKLTKSGKSQPGYHTINLGDLIHLNPGDVFKVVFKLNCDNYANIPIVETRYINKIPCSYGVSFFSKDGENWIELFDYSFSDFNHRYYSQIACIKAFTIFNTLNSSIKLDVSDKGIESANIKAFVYDQYGIPISSGEVIFTIDGAEYAVNVTRGVANLTYFFENKSNYTISAVFNSQNYNSSSDVCEIQFYEANMLLKVNNIDYGENLIANITLIDSRGNLLNDDVFLTVNGTTYKIHVDGKTFYKIPIYLNVGEYDVDLKYNDTLTASCLVKVSKANINMWVNIDEKRDNVTINVMFSKLINELVNISVSGKNYSINTTSGRGQLFIDDLDYGSHKINISFVNKNYNPIYKNYTIQTNVYKTKITPIGIDYVDGGALCLFNVSTLNNIPIGGRNVKFTLNDVTYENVTDDGGTVCVHLNLINGNYMMLISFMGYDDIGTSTLNYELVINRKPVVIQNISVPAEINIFDDKYVVLTFSGNAEGKLMVTVDGNKYLDNYFKSDQFNISLSNLTIGSHQISINYTGIEGYVYCEKVNILVKKAIPTIGIRYGERYVGKVSTVIFDFPIYATGYLFMEINGNNYYSEITNGKAVFKIDNLVLGRNSLTYSYDGDENYYPMEDAVSFDVGYKYKLNANDFSMNYNDKSTYKVKVSYSNGGIVSSGVVLIKIDGKSYKVNIKNGVASFSIDLKPKHYTITAEYDGVKVSNKIVVKSILKSKNYNVKKSAKKLVIKASLTKINGKYLKGKKITFKLNGKTYVAKTNKKGIAKITIKKNVLKKLKVNKKYDLQIAYLKDTIKKVIKVKK